MQRNQLGFTLFEVLIALALSVLLLAAVFGAIDLSWKYLTAGQAEGERTQLTRALHNEFELQLRSVVFQPSPMPMRMSRPPWRGPSTPGIGRARAWHGARVARRVTRPISLLGSATSLVLRIGSDDPRDNFVAPEIDPGQQGSRGERLVMYTLARNRMVEVPPVARNGPPTWLGIGREFGGGLVLVDLQQSADRDRPLELARNRAGPPVELLAEEVTELRFRYFDGEAWLEQWNGDNLARLPRAVEVSMRIGTAEANGSSRLSGDSSARCSGK